MKFLLGWPAFTACLPQGADAEKLAKLVYKDCRCALLHSGSTGNGLKVGVSGNAFECGANGALKLNRTALHEELKVSFETYLQRLRAAEGAILRENFRKKMDAICGVE